MNCVDFHQRGNDGLEQCPAVGEPVEGDEYYLYVETTIKGGNFAKIELTTCQVTRNNLKPKELKRALAIIEIHQAEFIRKWDDYFTQR